jgi:hypothetical protein
MQLLLHILKGLNTLHTYEIKSVQSVFFGNLTPILKFWCKWMDQASRKPKKKLFTNKTANRWKLTMKYYQDQQRREQQRRETINKRIPRHMTTGKLPSRTWDRTGHKGKQWTVCHFKSPNTDVMETYKAVKEENLWKDLQKG